MDEKNETGSAAPEMPGKQPPLRRVGSFTLGACLIAAGAFFLCYHFVPGFDWQLALKIVPAAGLVMLGGEVLYFAAKPEKWKYDFLSVFYCLLLMGVCLCMGALPMMLDRFGPENEMRVTKITAEYEEGLYHAIGEEAPEIELRNLSAWLQNYYGDAETVDAAAAELNSGLGTLQLNIELFGPYEKKAAFAMDCRKLTDIIQKQAARPASVTFFYDGTAGNAEEDLNRGSVKPGCSYTLTLNGEVQLNWSADRMAQQTEATALLEEENDSFAEYEAAESEAAD